MPIINNHLPRVLITASTGTSNEYILQHSSLIAFMGSALYEKHLTVMARATSNHGCHNYVTVYYYLITLMCVVCVVDVHRRRSPLSIGRRLG